MNNKIHHKIIDDTRKQIKLTYNDESATFELTKRRAFVVLKELVKRYPKFMNIHELDGIYNDPNRALSDLRNEDGFEPFIEIELGDKGVTYARLDIKRLFQSINKKTIIIKLSPHDRRVSIPEKEKRSIFDKFKGICNITGIPLHYRDDFDHKTIFLKNAQLATFDHRKPLVKTGSNEPHNWQLVSRLVNQEKNKICNSCIDSRCDSCALAHPERVSLIWPTQQNIAILRRNGNG